MTKKQLQSIGKLRPDLIPKWKVKHAVENFFAPDIRLTLDADFNIIGRETLTVQGVAWSNVTREISSYDHAMSAASVAGIGACVETNVPE